MSYVCIHSSTTADDADKLLAAFYLCLSTTTLVTLLNSGIRLGVFTLAETVAICLLPQTFDARTTFRKGGPYFAGKNWTGRSTFYPGPIIA